MGCVWFIYRKMELCYWLVSGNAKSASYTVDDIGRGTGKMISDLNGSLGS